MGFKIPTFCDVVNHCKNKGVTVSKFLTDCGLNRSGGTHWKNERSFPSYQSLKKIVDKLNQD